MTQFEVTHNGATFDLNPALDAVRNSYAAMSALDKFNARKNTAEQVNSSPLTLALESAYDLLFRMKHGFGLPDDSANGS